MTRALRDIAVRRTIRSDLVEAGTEIDAQSGRDVVVRLREQRARKLPRHDECIHGVARARRREIVLVMRAIPASLRSDGNLAPGSVPGERAR